MSHCSSDVDFKKVTKVCTRSSELLSPIDFSCESTSQSSHHIHTLIVAH